MTPGRSWWGWGNTAEQATDTEVNFLVDRSAVLLPDHDFTDHRPPDPASLEACRSPGSRPPRLAALCSTSRPTGPRTPTARRTATWCASCTATSPRRPTWSRARAREPDVVAVLDWAARAAIAVIPYGGGSSVVGGVEPRSTGPAVTLDLTALDRVLEVDPTSRAARIQAGALGPQLEDQLRPHGLTLRHFPQSFEFSTLGGWLATRAGGHYATLYTHIDDLVESMRVVTPAGISESRRLPGSGAGPSPDRLFLGSEGTLGVITEAWMRLQDRPRWQATASVTFDRLRRGGRPRCGRSPSPGCARPTAGCSTRARRPRRRRRSAAGCWCSAFESADHPVDAVAGPGARDRRATTAAPPTGATADRGDAEPAATRRAATGARRSCGCPTCATRWPGMA